MVTGTDVVVGPSRTTMKVGAATVAPFAAICIARKSPIT
jgi:hypothetical protein